MVRWLRSPSGMTLLLIAGPLLVGEALQRVGLATVRSALLALAVVLPAWLVALGVLSLGSLVGGWMLGFRVLLFTIGPLRLAWPHGRLICTRNENWTLYWGAAACVPYHVGPDLNRRMAGYLASGPLASALVGSLATALLAARLAAPAGLGDLAGIVLLAVLGPGSLFLAGMTLLPRSPGGVPTNGRQVISYLRGGPAGDHALARTTLASLNQAGRRPRDWPADCVERATARAEGSAHAVQGQLLAYVAALDRGQIAPAAVALDAVLARLAELPPTMQPAICAEAAYFVARHGQNAAAAQAWLDHSTGGWVQPADRARAEAAVALVAGRLDEARVRAQAGITLLDHSLGAGTAIAEAEWLREIATLATTGGVPLAGPLHNPVPVMTAPPLRFAPGGSAPRRRTVAWASFLGALAVTLGTLLVLNRVGALQGEAHAADVSSLPSKGTCGTAPSRRPHVGEQAPDFTVDAMSGGTVTLSQYRDSHPVWLHFWEVGCQYCLSELPDIEAVDQSYQAHGPVLLHLSVEDAAAEVAPVVGPPGYHGVFALDEDGSVMQQYCVDGVPTHVLIDRHGVIQRILVGRAGPAQLKAALDPLLGP